MDENAAVDGASAAELAAEDAARSLRNAQLKSNRTQGRRGRLKMSDADEVTDRLKFGANDVELSGEAAERVKSAANSKEAAKKAAQRKEMNRFFQRKRYKDAYKVARSGEVVVGQGANAVVQESITVKAKRAAKELLIRSRSLLLGVGIFALLFVIIAVSISSCSASIQGGGSVIGITTYPSTDEDIYAAENAYAALEAALNRQINSIESSHPGYDEYQYNVSEIWYLCLDNNKIIAGMGVIENDFHDRKDLTPNVCAVYTEEKYRCQGIAGKLLNMVVEDCRQKGISPVYLITDHTSFYERYGWEFLCMVQGDDEPDMTRMYIHR